MNTNPVRFERRAAQRFDVHLPVTVNIPDSASSGHGFTQDLSARGVFLYTDFPLAEGDAVELTLVMPSACTTVTGTFVALGNYARREHARTLPRPSHESCGDRRHQPDGHCGTP